MSIGERERERERESTVYSNVNRSLLMSLGLFSHTNRSLLTLGHNPRHANRVGCLDGRVKPCAGAGY